MWASTGQTISAPPLPHIYSQQNFPAAYVSPNAVMNGGFNQWTMGVAQPLFSNSNQLWTAAPLHQTSNLYECFTPGSWHPAVSDITQIHASMFSPDMDRCLPSELLVKCKEPSS